MSVDREQIRRDAQDTLDGDLPYEETWNVNARAVLALLAELEQAARQRDDALAAVEQAQERGQ